MPRHFRFILTALIALSSAFPLVSCAPPAQTNADQIDTVEARVRASTWQLLADRNHWKRDNGFIYTVDVGQLLTYAALAKDRPIYDLLHDYCLKYLIQNDPHDPSTRGYVVWRWSETDLRDATGTTEALRVAEGFWRGSIAFNSPADRQTALMILHGYARHAQIEQGVWIIANYYNFSNHSFATNSFTIDYDPDFIAEVATGTNDQALADLAKKSAALVHHTATNAGLFCDVIQPEIGTLLPMDLTYFAPNDVVQLANAVTIAERCASSNTTDAKNVLRFATDRGTELNKLYYGRTGEPVSDQLAGAELSAALVRLSARLGDQRAIDEYLPPLLRQANFFADHPANPPLWFDSEILTALEIAKATRLSATQ